MNVRYQRYPVPGTRYPRFAPGYRVPGTGYRSLVGAALAIAAASHALGAQSHTHMLVVVGAGGEAQYSEAFHRAAASIVEAARKRYGLPDSDAVYLGEDPARSPALITAKSSKANVERELERLAARARPGDDVWVVLIGHGSAPGGGSADAAGGARFNLPGPDMTAADFARLLSRFGRQRVAFVNTASASGDFVPVLAGRNRAVVTATKSSMERNGTIFAEHFANALAAPGADLDKDGGVSLLEAFTYARREVARAYESESRLLTEHAQLDDDGNGVATAEPAARGGDGALAASLVLAAGRNVAARSQSPRLAALRDEQRALEARLAELKAKKGSMDEAAYDRALEALLLDLARNGQAIRSLEGGSP